jgi:hypothetical protein
LLLKGGARFAGQLRLGAKDGGNPRDLVRIGSYGTGRATIVASGESGVVLYERVAAYGNRGDRANTASNSGSGILLGSVRDATVAWSAAYGNGGRGGAKREGPEGIWAYAATGVRFEHDLAYHNRSASPADGGGFEFDQDTSDSVMQYNLSYGNYGPGFELFGSTGHPQTRNVVRFNVSTGDGSADTTLGSVLVTGITNHAAIYQNTVVAGAPARPTHAALMLGSKVKSITVRNNIFGALRPETLVLALAPLPPRAARLQGNDYYAASGRFTIIWGRAVYQALAGWRAASGQEQLRDKSTGFAVNPRLTGPVLIRRGWTITGAGTAFTLRHGSRLRGAGLALLRLFGIHAGAVNFSGQRISVIAPNVGAQ